MPHFFMWQRFENAIRRLQDIERMRGEVPTADVQGLACAAREALQAIEEILRDQFDKKEPRSGH